MTDIIVVACNLRSAHNVGSLLRTAEGLGVSEVILAGYTPYPPLSQDDPRLPHEQRKLQTLIHKTALGAEVTQTWRRHTDCQAAIQALKASGYHIVAIEQASNSVPLPGFTSTKPVALLLGREVEGLEPELLALCDTVVEIPMFGQKESFNVVQAAAMALYHCRFIA